MPAETWAKVYEQVPEAPFGGGKDERELTEAFESFVGGPSRGFRLMEIHRSAVRAANGEKFRLHGTSQNVEDYFFQMAQRQGFTKDECRAYLDVR